MEQKLHTRIALGAGFAFLVGNLLFSTIRYIIALIVVQERVVSVSPLYLIFAAFIPLLWWLFSTISDWWNYYNRKYATLYMVIINFLMVLAMPVWTFFFNVFAYRICSLPTGRNLTAGMLLSLCRIAIGGATFIIGFGFFKAIKKIIEQDNTKEQIEAFRIQDVIDTRANKENLFDLHIVRDIKTGRDVPIKEGDRFVHMFVLGAPGTGKTSSTGTPSIICDLNKKMENATKRQAALVNMIKGGRAKVRLPDANEKDLIEEAKSEDGFKNDIEAEALVEPAPGCEEEYKHILAAYPDCGLTIMAPNNSLNDDVIKLAKARNLKVNVIDPAFTYENDNVRMVGINPFYVELGLSPDERLTQINNKAQTFAEILMAVNEINGVGDVYFRDINTSVTTNVAIACMLDANINGRQTNIIEVQQCIGEFHLLQPIVDDIQDYLHMRVEVVHMDDEKKKKKRGVVSREEMEKEEVEDASPQVETYHFTPCTTEDEIEEPYYSQGMSLDEYNEMLRTESSNYYETIHFILQELLGDGYEKMFDQARGLRNLINKLVLDPRVKKVLAARDENFIDWDKALERNEITVINTALEFGPQSSTALGLFVMLNLKIAVLRRPKNKRSDHFILIDEASQYMHPMYEDMFAIFRQYRVAVTLMMQTLSQMDKTPLTQYLRNVIMTAGTHIVFGRLNADEMKYYEAMAGITHTDEVQESTSYNSEFDDNHAISHSERTTKKDVATVAGADMRQRHFQECTVFKIDQGTVKSAFVAKVSFPKRAEYKDRGVTFVDWSRYFPKGWEETYTTKNPAENPTAAQSEAIARAHDTGINSNVTTNMTGQDFYTIPPVNQPEQPMDYRTAQPQVYERTEYDEEAVRQQRMTNQEVPVQSPMLGNMSFDDLVTSYGGRNGQNRPQMTEDDKIPAEEPKARETAHMDRNRNIFEQLEPQGEEKESEEPDYDEELPFGDTDEVEEEATEEGESSGEGDAEDAYDDEMAQRMAFLAKQNQAKGKSRFGVS